MSSYFSLFLFYMITKYSILHMSFSFLSGYMTTNFAHVSIFPPPFLLKTCLVIGVIYLHMSFYLGHFPGLLLSGPLLNFIGTDFKFIGTDLNYMPDLNLTYCKNFKNLQKIIYTWVRCTGYDAGCTGFDAGCNENICSVGVIYLRCTVFGCSASKLRCSAPKLRCS